MGIKRMRRTMINRILIYISVLGVLALAGYQIWQANQPDIVYFKSQELFNAYSGTKYYQEKLAAEESSIQKELDSLQQILGANADDPNFQTAIGKFRSRQQALQNAYQARSDQYTNQLWQQINSYVADYGRSRGVRFVLGATGNGMLMYADDETDVTEELTNYINARYEDE